MGIPLVPAFPKVGEADFWRKAAVYDQFMRDKEENERLQSPARSLSKLRAMGREEAPLYPTTREELDNWWDCSDWGGTGK